MSCLKQQVIRSFDFISFNDTKQVINYSPWFRRVEKTGRRQIVLHNYMFRFNLLFLLYIQRRYIGKPFSLIHNQDNLVTLTLYINNNSFKTQGLTFRNWTTSQSSDNKQSQSRNVVSTKLTIARLYCDIYWRRMTSRFHL